MAPRSKTAEASNSSASSEDGGDGQKGADTSKKKKNQAPLYSAPFDEAAIRRNFVTKVFAVFSSMLLITFAILVFFMFNKQGQDFIGRFFLPLTLLSMAVYLFTLFPLICFPEVARKVPLNYILLGVFTLSSSFVLAPISLQYDLDIILICVFSTLVVVFAVSLFSAYTSFDFTKCSFVAFVALAAFFLTSLISAAVWHFTGSPKWWNLAYGAFGVVLFILYLAMDIQKILGGRAIHLSPEDYIAGAIFIYVDTINIFYHLLVVSTKSKK